MDQFIINENGELEFKGEVFRVNSEFQFLTNEKKLEVLILLINWANNEIQNLNK